MHESHAKHIGNAGNINYRRSEGLHKNCRPLHILADLRGPIRPCPLLKFCIYLLPLLQHIHWNVKLPGPWLTLPLLFLLLLYLERLHNVYGGKNLWNWTKPTETSRISVVRKGHCKRYRAAQGHRAGVNADLTPSTGGPVGHACR